MSVRLRTHYTVRADPTYGDTFVPHVESLYNRPGSCSTASEAHTPARNVGSSSDKSFSEEESVI